MRYAPPATVYGLDLLGVKSKHSFRDRTFIFVKANVLALAIAFPLKGLTKVRRPDDSNSASFPSIHTTQAFVGATFMHKELGYKSVWYSIGGYTVATATGVYRILNNKHWLSDVLVGAAVGIFSTNLVYLTHHYKGRKEKKFSSVFAPSIYKGSYGMSCTIFIH
ncbi:phosphatase PAP2 family protein [Fulvivirga ligni]|uniref:phosphatase PAP2 family protein n=1 Tax=Fulvivirga ligni TaxID=2904246 RepID=UPI001F16621D|nr:phosphatase PAP2 family protein [Fulvivirga ligni]UII20036.1 phosphatase PAP2 family protein [Fulvivirga ligni]